MTDALKVIVLASTFSAGTLHEADGVLEHTFYVRNESRVAVRIAHAWTSCGCTTARFDDTRWAAPGDSVPVTLRFDMTGKDGDFLESARVQIVSAQDTTYQNLYLEGDVVPSAEHIERAYPVRAGGLRLSATTLDYGQMKRGESRTKDIAVYGHAPVSLRLTADASVGWGEQQLRKTVTIEGQKVAVVQKVLVIDDVSPAATSPVLKTPRRLPAGTAQLTLTNAGRSPLVVHRIYTSTGTDLVAKDVTVADKPLALPIPSDAVARGEDTLITIISNDPHAPRLVVRLLKQP